jgi:signal-transduction protein with cAMP-binding, CBS, and nucleotidyltransferase domain
MDSFLQAMSQFAKLDTKSLDELSAITKRHEFPKGHVLLQRNSICNYFYFIEKGLTRTFYIKDGKDITDWISTEGTFAVSLISFINREPDRRTIELLEPSVLYAIGYDDIEALCKQRHDIEHLVRQIVSFGLVQLQRKFDELHFSTAKQRYKNLMETNPTIIQRVPLGMVASFLGMTQETLSRIRSQITF